jgi:hypothetical protein
MPMAGGKAKELAREPVAKRERSVATPTRSPRSVRKKS